MLCQRKAAQGDSCHAEKRNRYFPDSQARYCAMDLSIPNDENSCELLTSNVSFRTQLKKCAALLQRIRLQ